MEFTTEDLGIMKRGIQKQIKNKDYIDEEDKQQLMDLCKKIGFKLKINILINCEERRIRDEEEEREKEEEEEVIQKPVKTYGKGKKYKKSYTEITKNPNEKTIRSYFKELNKKEIEEVEKSFKKKGKCVEITKNVCFYDKRYYIIFKFNNNSSIQKEVESNVWLDDFNMSWDRYKVNHNIDMCCVDGEECNRCK